jgi:hypothetical protein
MLPRQTFQVIHQQKHVGVWQSDILVSYRGSPCQMSGGMEHGTTSTPGEAGPRGR